MKDTPPPPCLVTKRSITELLILLKEDFGVDLNGYEPASLERRIEKFMIRKGIPDITRLLELIRSDTLFHVKLVQCITVNYTEMFRDPSFFSSLRTKVLPYLSTYPSLKIWIAGCSTGEEAYSMAILLHELGLLEHSRIYATDINESVLEKARSGRYSVEQIKSYALNYQKAGGLKDFSRYFIPGPEDATVHDFLREKIVFDAHNLASGSSINEFHLILCRNVFIYFIKELQSRVIRLFSESLINLGYLGIGQKETILRDDRQHVFAVIDRDEKLYRKVLSSPLSCKKKPEFTHLRK